MARIRAPKMRKESPEPFSADELARISAVLTAAGDGLLAVRNRAIVALLLDQGLRASELCGIIIDHINIASGDLLIVHGKGDKARRLKIGASARRPIRRYWLRYRQALGPGAFFLSPTGEPMTPNALTLLCSRIGQKAGIRPANPHRYRHTCAIASLRAGKGLFELQQMLGHTDLTMVRHYTKIADEDVARASQQHSALDHLKLNL